MCVILLLVYVQQLHHPRTGQHHIASSDAARDNTAGRRATANFNALTLKNTCLRAHFITERNERVRNVSKDWSRGVDVASERTLTTRGSQRALLTWLSTFWCPNVRIDGGRASFDQTKSITTVDSDDKNSSVSKDRRIECWTRDDFFCNTRTFISVTLQVFRRSKQKRTLRSSYHALEALQGPSGRRIGWCLYRW